MVAVFGLGTVGMAAVIAAAVAGAEPSGDHASV